MKIYLICFFIFINFNLAFPQNSLQYISSTTGAACYAIEFYNGYVYAGAGNTLMVYDVVNSSPPYNKVFEHRFNSNITTLKVHNGNLFAGVNHDGLFVYDISNPALLQLIDSVVPDSLTEAVYDFTFYGDSIFVAYKTKMATFYFDGNNLQLLNRFAYQQGTSLVRGCDVKNNLLAFTTAYGADSLTGVHLYDINTMNQLSFYEQGYCDPDGVIFSRNVDLLNVIGGTESWHNGDPHGLFYSLDISNPSSPSVAYSDTLGGTFFLSISQPIRARNINDTIYVATNGAPDVNYQNGDPLTGQVYIYDCHSPTNVHLINSVYAGLWHFNLALDNKKMFVASEWYGVKTVDITDFNNEIDLGNTPTGGWNTSADISGNKLVVANEGFGFKMFDVSNLANPVLIDTNRDDGFCFQTKFSPNGNYVYAFYYTLDDFRIYDSNTLNLVSSIPINPLVCDYTDEQVWNNKVIVIEAPFLSLKKILVIDVSNPLAPYVDTAIVMNDVNDIYVNQNGKLFVAAGSSVQVIDLNTYSVLVSIVGSNATAITEMNDTVYVNRLNPFSSGVKKYFYNGSNQLTQIGGTYYLPFPDPKFIAVDSFGLYADFQQYGLYAFDKNTIMQTGYFRHGLEFYRPDNFGQQELLCKNNLILLVEYFGQTSILTNNPNSGVGLNENYFPENYLSVYPDPTSEKILVATDDNYFRASILEIINTEGELMLSEKISKRENEIDVRFLQNGIYFVKLSNDKKCLRGKFLKM